MSTREASDAIDPIIEGIEDLAAPMIAGEKPRERWRIGTEHENSSIAPPITAPLPMTKKAASATAAGPGAVRLGVERAGWHAMSSP
jgi:gamma-glutamylcysteine synthetase